MQQLVQLIVHSTSQTVAAESIIVIKRLLQMNANKDATEKTPEQEEADRRDVSIIKQLARMLNENTVTVPQARAAIIWLVGEYNEKIKERAPDVLRCLAKSFLQEADIVKLQVLTLGAKLVLASEPEPPQPRVLEILRYVLQLAKYDVNYDIRDRARLVRLLLFSEGDAANNEVRKNAKTLFLSEKPVPAFESVTDLCTGFVLGTLSHVIHDTAPGYRPLEDFPEEAPDPTTRNPPAAPTQSSEAELPATKIGSFTGIAPGEDPDNYLFGEEEGLGDDADDGWGAGWDDDEEEGGDDKKKKSTKAAEDDWGMGDDDWGMGGDEPKQEAELSWDLEDDGAEASKKEEEVAEKTEEKKAEDDDDGWGMVDEEPKEEEEEGEPKHVQKMLGDADVDEADSAPAPVAAPEPVAEAPAPEEPAPSTEAPVEEQPAKEEEAPVTEESSTSTVAAVEEGEAEE